MSEFFAWDESLRIGVPLVDHDHQFLVSLINQLHDAVGCKDERDVVETVLDALVEYTVYHFGREERVMEACGFPDFAAHRKKHQGLARKVLDTQQRFRDNRDAELGPMVLDFLKDWLRGHILGEDTRIREFAARNPAAIRAASQIPRMVMQAPGGVGIPAVDWQDTSVLIVEGNSTFRKVLNTILQTVSAGDVREAENGTAALALMKDFVPDVVLADWFVEDMDALEMIRAMRNRREELANVSVVLLLGPETEEVARGARDLGVQEFLEKPVTAKGLLATVARAALARN